MPRKILFSMCGQRRYDYLGCTRQQYIKTTHIDALSKQGEHFDRKYVPCPFCGPSRRSFYTGRYAPGHGASDPVPPFILDPICCRGNSRYYAQSPHRDDRSNYIRAENLRPMFYDLETDPEALVDQGDSNARAGQRAAIKVRLFAFQRCQQIQVTVSDARIEEYFCMEEANQGMILGFCGKAEFERWKATEGN